MRKAAIPERPAAKLPGQIIGQLMAAIRGMFCRQLTDRQWGQFFGFIRREVVTWPAAFLAGKGFGLPPERYIAVMMEIFKGIKVHGDTGRVNFWPGYLQKCVQSHFQHNWEDYYAEAKSARALAERALFGLASVKKMPGSDEPVETLAAVHQALKTARKKKARTTEPKQLPLI